MPLHRGDLNDAQWQKLYPLLPKKARTGRPAAGHRAIINGILWIHRTGAPWDDLPECYGSRGTVSSRFYRWRAQGIWQEILNRLQQNADAANQIDWEVHFIDSTIVRAHQHAAGAKRGNSIQDNNHSVLSFFSNKRHLDAQKGALVPKFTSNPMAWANRCSSC